MQSIAQIIQIFINQFFRLNMNFTFIPKFYSLFINLLKVVFCIHLCNSQNMNVYYETHKSSMIGNKDSNESKVYWSLFALLENNLKEQLPNSEDGISFNSYGLESMPLEIILHMDKTMALLEFDSSGKVLEKCQLIDLEKESDRADSTASINGLPVITSDFKTMQEAINKCTELSEKLSPVSTQDHSSPNITTESSISLFSLWRGLIPGTKVRVIYFKLFFSVLLVYINTEISTKFISFALQWHEGWEVSVNTQIKCQDQYN